MDDPEVGDFRFELAVLTGLLGEPCRYAWSLAPLARADDDDLKGREAGDHLMNVPLRSSA
jgi:hypothetical protein